MNGTVPLILNVEPVTKENWNKSAGAHVAVVYTDAGGNILDGTPSKWSAGRKYRTRYEVDRGVHHRKARMDNTRLPSVGGLYSFDAEVEVKFTATSTAAIVRNNVVDALPIVYGHLVRIFWPVTRTFEITSAPEAEKALNRLLRDPKDLPEGITILECVVRLTPEAKAQQYLLDIEAATQSVKVGDAQHEADMAAAGHQKELNVISQRARLDAEGLEHAALAERPVDVRGMILNHVARNPDQTQYATEMLLRYEAAIAEKQDADDKRHMDLVRYMSEQGLLQPVDVQHMLRGPAVSRMQEIASPAPRQIAPAARPTVRQPSGDSDPWNEPLPGVSPALALKPEAPTPAAGTPALAGPKPADTVPIYLIADESPSHPAYFEALNNVIGMLPAELAADPRAIEAVRLAVIGYGDEVHAHMPLNKVATDTYIPELQPRPGSNLGPVFDYLRERIVADVARNKSRGLLVARPVVYLLCASQPADTGAWQEAYDRLTDRDEFRAAPNIVACGIGEATAETIRAVTSHPQSYGWLADPGLPESEAAVRYAAFVRHTVKALALAHVTGKQDVNWESPDGFHPADEQS